jgi:predicted house-cleaning noncanonical NTP pyrophosphatase (MazG superfamily)
MNKQVLSPFDCDMCAMIEDITKQEIEVTASDTSIRLSWAQNGSEGNDKAEGQRIEALKQAIRGRLGDRFIEFFYADNRQSVYMKYDPEEYPEEIRTKLTDPDATAGSRYCRTLLEVDAIQFRRDNVDDVLRFTGGGTVTTPRTPDGKAMFSFPDGNGIFVDVPESWYIIRELNGRFTARPEKDFKREFEPKGIRTVGNYDGQPARPSITEIMLLFNELFGTNIASRCRKMEEEFNEYKEVVRAAMPTFDDPAQMNAVIDELADLNAVVFHSATILGATQRDLLEMAYDKVKGRQTDPNYKRTHPHKPHKGCGDCANFTNEDINGNGYCEAFKSEQSCGVSRCQEYKPRKEVNNEL